MALIDNDLRGRVFKFSRTDGSVVCEKIVLCEDGSIRGYNNPNERSWCVASGILMLKDQSGDTTSQFTSSSVVDGKRVFKGPFLPLGQEDWHVLTEIETQQARIVVELLRELYSNDSPYSGTAAEFVDAGYPHTNLDKGLAQSVLDVLRPSFWLEIGSMLGGSAIRTADAVREAAMSTGIVCMDPFTGDVNMWAWEREKRLAGDWTFLRLKDGRPTIYDRFLANVVDAGHETRILPVPVTTVVGTKLIRRLHDQGRITELPTVIYLDSAHEPGETLLELESCWALLGKDSILMGDDWNWPAVADDVATFAARVPMNGDLGDALMTKRGTLHREGNVLLDGYQWLLAK